jgi:hypothetical protein
MNGTLGQESFLENRQENGPASGYNQATVTSAGKVSPMSAQESGYDLFISYTRADNRDGWITALVEQLHQIRDEVEDRRWTVFFDERSIRTGQDWEQRLKSTLSAARFLVVFLSPAYFKSEWCRREWEEFRKQEQSRGQRNRIFPVYLRTDDALENPARHDAWRADLATRNRRDLRRWARTSWRAWLGRFFGIRPAPPWHLPGALAQLRQLERDIHNRSFRPLRAGVQYHEGPFWPGERFVDRPEELARLAGTLLGKDGERGVALSAVHGLGGVGKSTLAAALVREPRVRAAFPDGILWATLGQRPELATLLSAWIQALEPTDLQARTAAQATATLQSLLQNRQTLLVIDDVWNLADLEAFRVGGPRCRTLLTTRDGLLARGVGATVLDLNTLTPAQSETLLERCLGRSLAASEQADARTLCHEVGYLPLALELAAAQVHEGESWSSLVSALQAEVARLEALDQPGAEELGSEAHTKCLSLTASLNLSLQRLTPERRKNFAWLGAAAEDVALTVGLAATLWQTDEPTAAKGLQYLRDKALLLPALERPDGAPTYRLHDLFGDYARRLLSEAGVTPVQAQRTLLDLYRRKTKDGRWHTLPPDGYIHAQLGQHLERTGDVAGLHALLREETPDGRNGWYEATDALNQVSIFADDVARAWRLTDRVFDASGEPVLAEQCRCLLLTATLNSRARNLPLLLPAELVSRGVWSVKRALSHARLTPDAPLRGQALRLLTEYLSPAERNSVEAEALQSLEQPLTPGQQKALFRCHAATKPWRSEDILFESLSAEHLRQALAAALTIFDQWKSVPVLIGLARQLPEVGRRRVLVRTFDALLALPDPTLPGDPLTTLTASLSTPQIERALSAACALPEQNLRRAIIYLLLNLRRTAPEERTRVLEAILASPREYSRARAVVALAADVPEQAHRQLVARRLEVALGLPHEELLASILVFYAPYLTGAEVTAVLASVQSFDRDQLRIQTLVDLTVRLPATERAHALMLALLAILSGPHSPTQLACLNQLTSHVPPEELNAAASNLHPIERSRYLEMLRVIGPVPALPPDQPQHRTQLPLALEKDEWVRLLRSWAESGRGDVLENLERYLAPFLALAGPDCVLECERLAEAILDIIHWFP